MKRHTVFIMTILSVLLTTVIIITNCNNTYSYKNKTYLITANMLIIIPEPDPQFTEELVSHNELKRSIADIRQSRFWI
jgi:hypothetical protein